MKNAIICIFGSRGINNYQLIRILVMNTINTLELNPIEFVNGCGKGNKEKKGFPDEINEILSQEILKRESEKFEPEWYKYKGGAGFINNEKMAHYLVKKIIQGLEVLSFGFWDGKSKGTKDMISKLNEKIIPLILFKI